MGNTFVCYQGEQFDITVSIVDETGTAIDITGATLTLAVKRNLTAGANVFTSTGTIASATGGTATFPITETDTATAGTYVYVITIDFSNGDIRKTSGEFVIERV